MDTSPDLSFTDFLHRYSVWGQQPFFLLDLSKSVPDEQSLQSLVEKLPALACPRLLVLPETALLDEEYQKLFDVVVSDSASVQQLIANIEKTPFAAMVLVQLLRHNEKIEQEGGLFAESLAYSTLQQGEEFQIWLQKHSSQAVEDEGGSEPVLLEREGSQLMITLNRPEHRNAYNTAMRDGLYEALSLLDADLSIERCVIKGAGDCFSVGGDLEEFGQFGTGLKAHGIRSVHNVAHLLIRHHKKVECHVHRACIGSGIELPAFAGRVVAEEGTFFQLPELSMGLIPGAGGTVSILRRIGRQNLAWWVLSGKKISEETALQWGLIDEVIDRKQPTD